jgi:uncharacterized protein YpuA (DUF1002 family)
MDATQITNTVMMIAIGLMVVAGVLVGSSSLQTNEITRTCSNTSHAQNSTYVNCYGYTCDQATIPTLNATKMNCYNATGNTDVNFTTSTLGQKYTSAANITSNTANMVNGLSDQLGTVGTMFGVALILGAIGLIGLGIGVGVKNMR